MFFSRGSGGPERSRRILAFQTLKEQFPVPMNFQNFPKPLLGGRHALFCTFSFGSGVVVWRRRGGPPLCEKDPRGHGLGGAARLGPGEGASGCVLMVGQAAAMRLRRGLWRAALLRGLAAGCAGGGRGGGGRGGGGRGGRGRRGGSGGGASRDGGGGGRGGGVRSQLPLGTLFFPAFLLLLLGQLSCSGRQPGLDGSHPCTLTHRPVLSWY